MQRLLIVSMIVVLVATPLRGDSDETLAHPVAAVAAGVAIGASVGAGAVYGSYKFYKWMVRTDKVAKKPEQPRQDGKP